MNMPDLSLAICMAGLPVEIRSESQKTQHDPKIRQVLPVLAEDWALARNTRLRLGPEKFFQNAANGSEARIPPDIWMLEVR